MKALVLAAGKGQRLEPLTARRPKPMISICGEPVLERLLGMIRTAGIGQVEIVVGHARETIVERFGRGDGLGFEIDYAYQESQDGIGRAILASRSQLEQEDYFLLAYGDVVTSENLVSGVLDAFATVGRPVAAVCLPRSSGQYGNVYMDADMRIVRLLEKPDRGDLGNYVLAGVFVLPGSLLGLLHESGGDLVAALGRIIQNEGLYASIWEEEWVDLAYPWDILAANRLVMDGWKEARIALGVQISGSVELRGTVILERGVRIESGSSILGPCYIGRDAYIGHHVLVRPYTSLGAGCTVGYGVELKNSVVFGGAEIGRLSFVGDSVIGKDVDLGAGLMTVNRLVEPANLKLKVRHELVDTGLCKLGALIGDGARIGASNTLLPGTRIPAGAVVPHKGARLELPEDA